MLYDISWLCEGGVFPPRQELERLKAYKDNRALFKGDIADVLAPYRQRVKNIVARFADFDGWGANCLDRFELELNYFQLMTLKTGDLITGEPPTITTKDSTEIPELIEHTNFNAKLLSIVYDISRFGDSVARLKMESNKKNNFVVISPDMWFPIVSREDASEILYQVIAWVECLNPNAPQSVKKEYVVKTQIHSKGYYDAVTFAVKDARVGNSMSDIVLSDGQNMRVDTYTLGQILETKRVKTGLDDFAIVSFHNTTTSDSIYGLNDYDRIISIIAELQVRYALESLILDKHSAPTLYVPDAALRQKKSGEWTFTPGGVIPVGKEEPPPGYLVWDASLQANHIQIEKLEKHLYSLSEMGAIVNDDSFGASQGFEALETRMTNARLKARRMSSCLTEPLKKLLGLLTKTDNSLISICWNDGLPNNEFRETDIATKKLQGGLFDLETILMEHFGKSVEDAEKIAEKVRAVVGNSLMTFDDGGEDGGLADETKE